LYGPTTAKSRATPRPDGRLDPPQVDNRPLIARDCHGTGRLPLPDWDYPAPSRSTTTGLQLGQSGRFRLRLPPVPHAGCVDDGEQLWCHGMAGRGRRQGSCARNADPADRDGPEDCDRLAHCAELAREEWNENKALCAYCQVATLCSILSVALAVPEMRRAIRTLRGRS